MRNYETDRVVRDEIVPGTEWVINGEGVATRKYNGTCCMIKDGKLYKRYDVKKGRKAPNKFIPAQEPDEITGHWPGWLPVNEDNPSDKYHIEAFADGLPDGTYELCGPKIQDNPEKLERHVLIPHGKEIIDAPRTYSEIKEWLKGKDIEGIVWHRGNGDMVKIKKRDFGFKR